MAEKIFQSGLDIAALRELMNKTTPRPWEARGCIIAAPNDILGSLEPVDAECGFPGYEAEAKLIVAAVNSLSALLDVAEAAQMSAELAPRVPDGNKFGHDWTIPNPVIAALDRARREAGNG